MDANTKSSTGATVTPSAVGIQPAGMPTPSSPPTHTPSPRAPGSTERPQARTCSVAWMLTEPLVTNEATEEPSSSSSTLASPATLTATSPPARPCPVWFAPFPNATDEDESIRNEAALILMSISRGEEANKKAIQPAKPRCRLTLRMGTPPPPQASQPAGVSKARPKPRKPSPLKSEVVVKEAEEEKVVVSRSGRVIKKRRVFE